MEFLDVSLGLVTGALLGLLGGGGSIVAVPIMIYVLGLDTKAAIGTSLVVVGAASLLAAVSHHMRHYVLVRTALIFGGAGALGSYLGAVLGKSISDSLQLAAFACAMALIGGLMLRPQSEPVETDASAKPELELLKALLAGGAAGLLTGLLGVGGGFIIVPALMFVVGLPIRQAVGTSLVVIGMNSLVAAATYWNFVRLGGAVFPFIAGTVAAAPVAAYYSHRVSQQQLKTGLAITLLVLSAFMLTKQILGF